MVAFGEDVDVIGEDVDVIGEDVDVVGEDVDVPALTGTWFPNRST